MTNTTYRKTLLELPSEVSSAFDGVDTEIRNAYVAELRAAGWTLQSISGAAGITRERVRQIVAAASDDAEKTGLPVPTPPEKPKPEPRVFIEPDPEKLARMLELQPLAQKVRANSTNYRDEAEEYTALLAESHLEDGVTLYRLALRLGVTHGALRFRLARYGYKHPKEGSSKVYTPIKDANRTA